MSSCFPARCWSRLAFSSKCARWPSPTHSRGCPITAASSAFLKRSLTVRAARKRPFSIVLLDMDGLKIINDHYGHLTGSRALVRIGKILRNHSRAIDTPRDTAAMNSRWYCRKPVRTSRHAWSLESESASPLSLSALRSLFSAGVAAFPEDGDTPEKLLGAADRALYAMKHHSKKRRSNLTRIAACL